MILKERRTESRRRSESGGKGSKKGSDLSNTNMSNIPNAPNEAQYSLDDSSNNNSRNTGIPIMSSISEEDHTKIEASKA
jgi:hypothetical protein